nr:hypothetical protein [Tanacetum cinerariifolium]
MSRAHGVDYEKYLKGVADEANRHMLLSFSGQAGELVQENSLFDFEGEDVAGLTWTAEGVDIFGGNYRSEFCVVEGSIGLLSSRRELSERGSLSERFSRAIVKTLSVLSGVRLQLGVTERFSESQSIVELYSRDPELSNNQLFPPVEIPFRCPSDFFGSIFNLLVEFFEHDGAVYYDNWNKLNRAWQTGLESTALNVSVCIEGVLKAYYEERGTDRDFSELARHAIPEVMGLEVDNRIKNLLCSCLGGSGNFKPKSALRALTEAGEISPDLAGKWNRLRSETAHAVVTQAIASITKLADSPQAHALRRLEMKSAVIKSCDRSLWRRAFSASSMRVEDVDYVLEAAAVFPPADRAAWLADCGWRAMLPTTCSASDQSAQDVRHSSKAPIASGRLHPE